MPARVLILLNVPAVLALMSTGCGGRVEPAIFAQVQRAQEAFAEAERPADFLRVAAQYQEMLDSGLRSGAVLYNQGNAFMRAGQRGRAIACYRQACRYRPRDPYLAANLAAALSPVTTDRPRKPFVEYILFWQDWISYPEKVRIDMGAAVVTFVLAVVGLYWRPRLLNRAALAMLLVTAVLAASVAYDWYRVDVLERGVVVAKQVTARKGDAESYAPAFTQALPEGAEFVVVERRGDWLLIELPGTQQGWIDASSAVTY